MKILIFTISILFSFSNTIFAQGEMGPSELLIKNRMVSGNLQVKIYPIGMIFGTGTWDNQFFIYTPKADENDHPPNMEFITGATSHVLIPYIPGTPINPQTFYRIDQDGVSTSGGCQTTVGYGKYRIDIYMGDVVPDNWILIRSFTMDWSDSDYPNSWTGGLQEDLKIYVISPTDIRFHWGGGATEPFENHSYDFHELSVMNNELKVWYQYRKDINGNVYINQKVPNKNNFRTTNFENNLYLNSWPINGLNFLNPGSPNIHITPGLLNVSLEIQNNHHAKINANIPFIVNEGAKLKLQNSSDYNSNSRLIVENNANCYINSNASLEIGNYGNVLIENGGKLWLENNSNSILNNYGTITVNSGGNLYNCGANFLNSSNTAIKINSGGNYNVGYQNCSQGIINEFNQNSYFLLDGGTIYVSDNATLLFRGSNTTFETKNGSSVILGQNASIEFENGARLIANGTTFTSSGTWNGITLTNSKGIDIYNCTFNNLKSGISINNTNPAYSEYSIKLEKCTLNIFSQEGISALYMNNAFNVLVKDNTFNVFNNYSSKGLDYWNSFSPQPSESPGYLGYDIKIVDNRITGFQNSIYLFNTAAAFPYMHIFNNKFTGFSSGGNYSTYPLISYKINGKLKDNKTLNSFFNYGMFIFRSQLEMYNNDITSRNNTLGMGANSVAALSPVINTSGNYVWYGGRNKLHSLLKDNIVSNSSSSIFLTDRGYNYFHSDQGNHINASINASVYNSTYNCWAPTGIPVYNFSPQVTFNYQPSGGCDFDHTSAESIINDLGDGVIDTISVTSYLYPVPPSGDEMIYSQARELFGAANFYNSSNQYMSLIDNYMESDYRYSSLYDLYSCYEYMDTSSNPGIGFGLWNEFYEYLLLKIEQYNEDYDFQDIAYNLSIMSQINMQEYEDAMYKYEGIILEHPDPVQRLLASWDYDALIEMLDSLDGEGGSIKSNFNFENSILAFAGKNFDDLEPVQKSIHQNYRERRIEIKRKSEERINVLLSNELNEHSKTGVLEPGNDLAEEMRKEGIKREIESRARANMMQSKFLSREEKEVRMMEDIDLMVQLMGGNVKDMESTSFTPQTYKLEQNYPNPFNPSTIISFSIPTSSLVKLNVYDITGRLIKVLVNEMKEAGNHNITFDGSGLSSGVYFYKLETGEFKQTKRMIMIK